jgi:hypothetical protein
MLMKSVEKRGFASNVPYLTTIEKSPILHNFFFDGIAMNDSTYFLAISNNGGFSLWIYNGKKWKNESTLEFPIEGFFSLFNYNGHLYVLLSNGNVHELAMNSISPAIKTSAIPAEGFLILNRDKKQITFLLNSKLDNSVPINELIQKKSIAVFN